jgi:hypothetical protein
MGDQLSHSNKSTGKIIVLHVFIFASLVSTWKDSGLNGSKHYQNSVRT